jgi:hypothetical protein
MVAAAASVDRQAASVPAAPSANIPLTDQLLAMPEHNAHARLPPLVFLIRHSVVLQK